MALTSNSASSNHFERDCQEIHRAWDQPGQLGRALAHRTPTERHQIKESYKTIYGKDLMERLRNHREVPVCDALYLWMLNPHERDAVVAREAMMVVGGRNEADYKALIEMYTRRKSSQLFFTRQAYVANFKTHLEQDILSDQSSHSYQKILAALATSHRSHHEDSVSQHIAKCDAMKLYGAIMESTGLNEATILEIMSKRSIPQLRLGISNYNQIYGHDFTTALKRGCRSSAGEFGESLSVAIQCMCHPFDYYSEMVYASLKGGARTRRDLTRVVMGSAEAGMEQVSAAFEKRYGSKIQDAIRENVVADGDYRDFLLALTNI